MINRTASFIAALRRRALAYRYDFSPTTNARIISNVCDAVGEHLEDTNDDRRAAARTIAHYLAQLALRPKWSMWIFEMATIPALPLFLLYAGLKSWIQNKPRAHVIDGIQLVFPYRFNINPEIFCIPDDLANADIAKRTLEVGFLSGRDILRVCRFFLNTLELKTPFPTQLALKCAIDLSRVRRALNGLAPKWVIVYWEFNCALSFVNSSLKKDNIATYNVMHGEKNFFAKNAFFEVARCYCWDSHYIGLFRRGFARADFKVFQNPAFKIDGAQEIDRAPARVGLIVPDLVTLSADPQEATHLVKKIAGACNSIAESYDVSVRPHPVYEEGFVALHPFINDKLKIVTIQQESARAFILHRSLLIGTNSTMLLEAVHMRREVVMLDTPVSADQERHRYIHYHPNVTTCSIDALASTVLEILSRPTPDRFPQTGKTGTERYES